MYQYSRMLLHLVWSVSPDQRQDHTVYTTVLHGTSTTINSTALLSPNGQLLSAVAAAATANFQLLLLASGSSSRI